MRNARRQSKTTTDGLESECSQRLGRRIALTDSLGHDDLGRTIDPRHNQIIATAGLRQRANKVHTPMSERLNGHTRERVNPQSQPRGAFSSCTRAATSNEMSNVSEQVGPPEKLRNISRRTSDARVARKSVTMCHMQNGIVL